MLYVAGLVPLTVPPFKLYVMLYSIASQFAVNTLSPKLPLSIVKPLTKLNGLQISYVILKKNYFAL